MTTAHQLIKHHVECNGAQAKLAYVRWAPDTSTTQTLTDAQGVTSVTRTSLGLYVVNFAGSPNIIIPVGSEYVEDDATVRHVARVKSTDTTLGACKATVDHRVTTFATEAALTAVTVRLTDISTSSSVYVVCPVAGTVKTIYTALAGAIGTADAAITTAISTGGGAFVAITGGDPTGAYTSSAAGDMDSATPSAANTVIAGDVLRVTTDGASTNTVTLDVTFLIQGSGATPIVSDTVDELCFSFLLVGGNL